MQTARLVVGGVLLIVFVGVCAAAILTRDPGLIGLATALTAAMAAPLGFLFQAAIHEAVRREVQARGEETVGELRTRASDEPKHR